jgi:hypothetical protein
MRSVQLSADHSHQLERRMNFCGMKIDFIVQFDGISE